MWIVAGNAGIHPDFDRVQWHVAGSVEVAGAADLVQILKGQARMSAGIGADMAPGADNPAGLMR